MLAWTTSPTSASENTSIAMTAVTHFIVMVPLVRRPPKGYWTGGGILMTIPGVTMLLVRLFRLRMSTGRTL